MARRYPGSKDLTDDIAGLAARHPRDRISVIINPLRMACYFMINCAQERLVLGWQASRMPQHLEEPDGWVESR